MIKFRLYFDKDKETEWLNKLAKEGLAMTGFFAGFYTFEKCEPGKYIYQIDLGDKLFAINENYREFMEENGIEIVQSWGYWIILRKLASEGEFKLYTDVDSSIEHYTKIRNMFKAVTILELICFFIECFCAEAGNTWAIFFTILIGILLFVLLKAVLHTNEIIAELKERKGEVSENTENKISPLLTAGLLMNSAALIMQDSISNPIKLGVQILAIIFMLVGLTQCKGFTKK
ncbi:MAG: DUF2812 domain-containing protein [Lachnospiraceae bacterium]|nr:DUF2812 domain-containing protein [Lachnospiraceae bacterium]